MSGKGETETMTSLPRDAGERAPCYPDLRGRVALVTGGGSGIGRGIALRLAAEGMKVGICGRRSNLLEETVESIEAASGTALAVTADIGEEAALDGFVTTVERELGPIDAVVHNAMFMDFPPLEEQTPEKWDQAFSTGPRAGYLLARRLIPGMVGRGRGGIVLVSSVLAERPNRNGLAYVSAKGALEAMARQLAVAFAGQGVRVNALAPGLVMGRPQLPADGLKNDLIPVGRAATPAEMAAVVAFLLSQQSSYITGQTIHADGGTSVQLVPPGFRL